MTNLDVRSGLLDVSLETTGPPAGWPVVLLHGFPYGPQVYEEVARDLAAAGARVLVPYLRGFGPTRFAHPETPRSGQQAAIGRDLLDLVAALELQAPIVVGYDWGGRAACVAGALQPLVIGGIVALGGYSIQDIAASIEPADPADESADWYQYYFHSERGRAGLSRNRRELALMLWRQWSPARPIAPAAFERVAPAFDNPDFVEVVIHSYRHRFGLEPGDPRYDDDERVLAGLPVVDVPAIVLDPVDDPAMPPSPREEHEARFPRLLDYRQMPGGHNQPFDAPAEVARAVHDLHAFLET